MAEKIPVLLIEDNPGDARIVKAMLEPEESGAFTIKQVSTLEEGMRSLTPGSGIQIILLDLGLPDENGLQTLRRIMPSAKEASVVVLTGLRDEELGIAAIREGAHDYVIKGQVDGGQLRRILRYAVERHKILGELHAEMERRARVQQALQLSEQILREKNIELENASLAKNRFLARMSHELRTPLNAIIGFTGTLLMKLPGPLTEDQEKQLRTIQTSGRHLLSLINDLLDLTKIESGRFELNMETLNCRSIIEEVSATLRTLAEGKNLRFEVSVPDHDLMIRTDRRSFTQILMNLTNNAIKFTDKGAVRIELRGRHDNGNSLAEISIVDTGIGIRPEDQAKLFQAFMQVDGSSTRPYEGTGLGLHVSQKLASMIGGRVSFESEYGKGSRFTISLPVIEEVPRLM